MLKAPCAVLRAACKRARANTERALLPVSMCKAWMWHGHHEPVRPTASAVACTQVLHLSGAAACMQVSHAPGITALHALQHPWANMTLCVHSSALKRGCLPARGRDRAARFAGPCAQRVNRSLPRMRPAHVTRSSELEGVDAFMRELLGLLEHCMGKLPLEQVRAAAQAGRRNAYECHRLQVKDAGVEGACVCVLVCVCVCARLPPSVAPLLQPPLLRPPLLQPLLPPKPHCCSWPPLFFFCCCCSIRAALCPSSQLSSCSLLPSQRACCFSAAITAFLMFSAAAGGVPAASLLSYARASLHSSSAVRGLHCRSSTSVMTPTLLRHPYERTLADGFEAAARPLQVYELVVFGSSLGAYQRRRLLKLAAKALQPQVCLGQGG